MTKIKLLLLATIPLFILSCAAKNHLDDLKSEEFYRADSILLEVDQSPDQAYKNFVDHLANNGFNFENVDKESRVLQTSLKNVNEKELNNEFRYFLDVYTIDADSLTFIHISGEVEPVDYYEDFEPEVVGIGYLKMDPYDQEEVDIEYKSVNGTLEMESWNQMKEVATTFPHESVYFK